MSETLIKIGSISQVPAGSAKVFLTAEGKRLAICHTAGKIYALDDICTHDGGPLGEGELTDGQIECPRHGARFDVATGKPLCLPAVVPVATYHADVRGDDIYVHLPAQDRVK